MDDLSLSLRTQSRPESSLQMSPRSLYCRRKLKPIIVSTYRTNLSPASSPRKAPLALSAKGEYWTRVPSRAADSRSKWYLSVIEEKLRGKPRTHSRRFQSEIDQRTLAVKGISPISRRRNIEQLVLEKVLVEGSLLPGRESAVSYITPKPRQPSPFSPSRRERQMTAAVGKRAALRPLTSEVKSVTTASEQTEETYDDLTAWESG